MPATKTYKETRITFRGIRLEEGCVVVDTDYHGHYGEYTESYSTFIPNSEEEYERKIAFYYLLSTLDDITDKQLRDWAIFNNKPIRFEAGGAVDLKGNAIPFKSESTAKSLLYDYFGDPHEYRPNDPKRDELYAKNDMIAGLFYSISLRKSKRIRGCVIMAHLNHSDNTLAIRSKSMSVCQNFEF